MTPTNDDLLALADRLDGIEIYSVRANRSILGTRPIEAANNAVYEAAAALHAIVAERQAIRVDRLEAQEALLREALAALGKLHHAVCGETGFAQCVRDDSKTLYPWPALDVADHAARATLAKLRQHLGETE